MTRTQAISRKRPPARGPQTPKKQVCFSLDPSQEKKASKHSEPSTQGDRKSIKDPDHLLDAQVKTANPWLSKEDLLMFRCIAKRLSQSVQIDDALYYFYKGASSSFPMTDLEIEALVRTPGFAAQRGLERWSSLHHATQRNLHIMEVRTSVLLEQSKQSFTGRIDHDRLADVANRVSASSQRFARILAAADERMAWCAHNEHDKQSSPLDDKDDE